VRAFSLSNNINGNKGVEKMKPINIIFSFQHTKLTNNNQTFSLDKTYINKIYFMIFTNIKYYKKFIYTL